MKLARGKYVTFVDSDDWVSPRYLQSLITPVTEQRADISVVDFQLVDSEKCIYEEREGKNSFKVMDAKEVFKESLYQTYRDVCVWGLLLPKQLVQEYPFTKGKLFEDLYTTYHYYFNAKKYPVSVLIISCLVSWCTSAHFAQSFYRRAQRGYTVCDKDDTLSFCASFRQSLCSMLAACWRLDVWQENDE